MIPKLRRVLRWAALAVVVLVASHGHAADDRPEAGAIDGLIEKLGDPQYVVRQRAEKELLRSGLDAFDALKAAERHPDLEIAVRARHLVARFRIPWIHDGDPPQIKRILRAYLNLEGEAEEQREHQRRSRVGELVGLPGDAGLEAVCRIVRFERSSMGSRKAALILLESHQGDRDVWSRWAPTLAAELGRSRRPACNWLRTESLAQTDSEAAFERWARLIDDEQQLLKASPEPYHAEVVTRLLYFVAEGRTVHRDERVANELAAQALSLLPQRAAELDPNWPAPLVQVPGRLRRRGLFVWAENEYRALIQHVQLQSAIGSYAGIQLAEMLHDQSQDLPASKVLHDVVQAMDAAQNSLRSRAEFFRACHFAQQKDWKKQKEHLDRAIEHDATDSDVLIAMYRLEGADEAYRTETRGLIEKAVAEFQRRIGKNANDATACNQLAWLVANTEGDLDEAIRLSHRSVKLVPTAGGYFDTLAHCYYAKKDYASAVKYQQQAVQFDPHSGQILRQFAVFKKALEQSQQGKK